MQLRAWRRNALQRLCDMTAEYPTGGRLTQKAIDRQHLTAFMCAPRYDDYFCARRHILYEFGEFEPIIGPRHVHVGDDEIERLGIERGVPIEEIFATWEREPFAAASHGFGVLRTDKNTVVRLCDFSYGTCLDQ